MKRGAKRLRIYKDTRGEGELFRRRAFAGFALILLGLCALVGRYVFLQVLHHDEFALRSVNNSVKPRAIPPARGLIYDRNGVLLADNVPAFRLEVVPDKVPNMNQMLAELGKVIPLDPDDLDAFRKQLKQSRRFDSVPLKMRLTEDDIARFAVNRWRFPGVDVAPYLTRYYPLGPLFAHVVGYVSRIDADDLQNLDQDRYKGTTHIGRIGVERSYEDMLHGTPGYELDEVNADGRIQRVLKTDPPVPGKNLYLSIDARIQKAAQDAFEGRPGAAVAIDPRNGQVLAMVSVPEFDPNLFVNGISSADYKTLMTATDKPLLNRALRGAYPPGSTVKPFMGLAGLEYGIRTPQDSVLSTGVFYIPGQSRGYRDDVRGGVGTTNLYKAIYASVNTYFYKLALDLGIDRISEFMGSYGFGHPSGVDLPGEVSGILPSREWKAKHSPKERNWYPGETVITGIGQGYWSVTAMQLAHALATFAGRGMPYAPRVVMSTADVGKPSSPLLNPPTGPSLIKNMKDWEAVNEGMQLVIYSTDPTSTGFGTKLGEGFPYRIAGKSGTAERFSRKTDAYNEDKNTAYLAARHRAWFEAFTPAENPRIAVAVVLEAGAWGAKDAGPIARKILDAWLTAQGGAVPPHQPLQESALAPASSTQTPPTPEDTPQGDVPAPDSSSAGDDTQ
ncbi:penicillin-binding protein 2 [Dyella nitratireducens]|uniref:Peptidoglycan D,D-transpeptidase MrdA n=1 Tax=Dyella nitratireducens TaxID=1849580 RepID=A0ABQ1FPD7_9GAMM|nr:penicillin-binding protein 2 [Dyella nitratireducens]GGA25091.1 penicillin-binding protein 2 [Dyella nitratireducens]GLQ43736.1 penicillin-binding protein 2 [Dyella nitratireducens]